MCDGLYLGAPIGQPRPNPFWTNPAIKPNADQFDIDDIDVAGYSDELDPALTQHIRVIVNNSQDYPIGALVELYWSDPTTGFFADSSRIIEYVRATTTDPGQPIANITVGGATAAGHGSNVANFTWVPYLDDPGAAAINGGHVCLLARVSHNEAPQPGGGACGGNMYDAASPTTDYRSAIHNIILVAGGAGATKKMKFAFAATNPFSQAVGTRLSVRALTPEKSKPALEQLLAPARNYRFAAQGRQFGVPNALGVALGHERVLARQARPTFTNTQRMLSLSRKGVPPRTPLWHAPRLGHTGVLTEERDLFLRGSKHPEGERQSLDLLPHEIRQAVVAIEPSSHADLFAFEVVHETTEPHPRLIGGITFIYRTRRALF